MFFSSPPWSSVTYWALDLETGGFDPRSTAIIAVGMVPIRGGNVRLRESFHTYVRPDSTAQVDPASVRAHQLVWAEISAAPPIGEVLPEIDRRLREGVLLLHHRALDLAFLRDAYRRARLSWPRPRVVDTVDLLVRLHGRRRWIDPGLPRGVPTLNLSKARREHGLPDYHAHDALTDAVATAELFLVLRHALRAKRLRDLR